VLHKTYYPTKVFDDNLVTLVGIFQTNGWTMPGPDTVQLAQDAEAQRKERAAYEAAKADFARLHEAFGLAQEERHNRYRKALNAARELFHDDKTVVAQLRALKDPRGSHAKKKAVVAPATPATPAAPAAPAAPAPTNSTHAAA
jgi:hypothetical protein